MPLRQVKECSILFCNGMDGLLPQPIVSISGTKTKI